MLDEGDRAIASWLDSLPKGAIAEFGRLGLRGLQTPIELADTLVLNIPLGTTPVEISANQNAASLLQADRDTIFSLFPNLEQYQIIYNEIPRKRVVKRDLIKTHHKYSTAMGKATTTKPANGIKQPRSLLMERYPRIMDLIEHCTCAVHGKGGEILALKPHMTTMRLFNPNIQEILGMPLTYLPSGIADPILEGIELAKESVDGYAVVRYEYFWNDLPWVFHVKFQHDRETGETLRLTYDDLEDAQQRQRQIDYWMWRIAANPEIAYVG